MRAAPRGGEERYVNGEKDLIKIRLPITSWYQKTHQSLFLLSFSAVTYLCFFDSSPDYWSVLWSPKHGRTIEKYVEIIAREGPQTQILQFTKVA